ncbi:SPOR domain-containing protein [Aquicella lusitana]|uniref:Sporulation related protein n=1 Tax=Aquicella lusitana TaxID=254246 RepID=A0A370GU46_9COXI|nr:SPOR domain-containing protein [Aquicella lusitana]RDI46074.1 sporulation related protein [Aquicella lusitana]VVC73329.1 Cell division protein DedD [Aquicella lusitana]
MERKTKHRILGILVVVGLIILLLPLLQSGKEIPTETTVVKAPPFPDQSVQVTTNAPPQQSPVLQDQDQHAQQQSTTNPQANEGVVNSTADNVLNDGTVDSEPNALTEGTAKTDSEINQPRVQPEQKDKIAAASSADIWEEELKAQNTTQTVKQDEPVKVNLPKMEANLNVREEAQQDKKARVIEVKPAVIKAPSVKKNAAVVRHAAVSKTVKSVPAIQGPVERDGLIKLKSAVWIIQIGSFKNKANALRLVNQLRAKGYPAFIQQVSTTLGSSTRVFVGPETNQSNARALANQLESEMRLRGIVLSYKPLAL